MEWTPLERRLNDLVKVCAIHYNRPLVSDILDRLKRLVEGGVPSVSLIEQQG